MLTSTNWTMHYSTLTIRELSARTLSLRIAAKRGHANNSEARFAALEREQERRCVGAEEAWDMARREDLARELAAEGNRSAQAYVTPDTRTCAFPGDHEHDHEMCNDSGVERAASQLTAEQRALYSDCVDQFGEDRTDEMVRLFGGDAMADALAMDLEASRG